MPDFEKISQTGEAARPRRFLGRLLSDGNEPEETLAADAAPNYLLAPVEFGRGFTDGPFQNRPSASH